MDEEFQSFKIMFTNILSIFSASSRKKCIILISLIVLLGISIHGVQSSFLSINNSASIRQTTPTKSLVNTVTYLLLEGEVFAAENNPSAYVAPPTATAPSTDKEEGFWVKLLNSGVNILFSLLTPFLILAGWLLSPDWVFGEVFWLRPVLYDLWKLMSNIVYVAFAFLLIVMAFMNIYGGEKNTWAIKTKLPKLIVGVITVPFTWFFVSAIISISTILTASTIQLAGDLSKNISSSNEFKFNVPAKCKLNFEGALSGTGSVNKFYDCSETGKKEVKLSEILSSENPYGIVSHYAYAVFKFDNVKGITDKNLWSLKTLADISMSLFIAILVFFIFMLVVAMLILALFMRAIHFWMIAIFSPLLSLKYFLEDKMNFGDKWLSIPKIISLAMVPVYVSAALAFGLVFISAIWWAKMPTSDGTVVKIEGKKMTAFGTEYEVVGNPIWVGNNVDQSADKSLSWNVFGQMIMYFIALAILWLAVQGAINSNEITKEAAQPVADFGNQIGGIIKKLPQYAPIIPTWHGQKNLSLNNLQGITQGISSAIQTRWNDRANDLWRWIAGSIGFQWDKITESLNSFNRGLPQRIGTPNEVARIVNELKDITNVKSTAEYAQQPASRKAAFASVVDRIWFTPEEAKKYKEALTSSNENAIREALAAIDVKAAWKLWPEGNTTDLLTAQWSDAFWRNRTNGATETAQRWAPGTPDQTRQIQAITINVGWASTPVTILGDTSGKITGVDSAATNAIGSYAKTADKAGKDKLHEDLTKKITAENNKLAENLRIDTSRIKEIVDNIVYPASR